MQLSSSERLSFRLMGRYDADLLFELDQDPEVLKYINGGKISTRDHIENVMIPRLEKYLNPEKGWGLWQVNVKDDGHYIGWILVRPLYFFSDHPELHNLELGWRFKRSAWGKGYATEAAKHIMDALSSNKNIEKFSAIAMPKNIASIGIMKKLGMTYVKTYLHRDPLGDIEVVHYEKDNRR